MTDLVIEATIVEETKKAYLVWYNDAGRQLWLPKSQIRVGNELSNGRRSFIIPEWLAIKKGLLIKVRMNKIGRQYMDDDDFKEGRYSSAERDDPFRYEWED